MENPAEMKNNPLATSCISVEFSLGE